MGWGCWAVGGCRSGGWGRVVGSGGPGGSSVAHGCGAGVPGDTMSPCPACRGSQVLCRDPWGALSKHTPCSGRTRCPGTGGHGAGPAERVAAARPTPPAGTAPARGPKSTASTQAGSLKLSLNPWAGSRPPTPLLEPRWAGGCGFCPSARLPGPATTGPGPGCHRPSLPGRLDAEACSAPWGGVGPGLSSLPSLFLHSSGGGQGRSAGHPGLPGGPWLSWGCTEAGMGTEASGSSRRPAWVCRGGPSWSRGVPRLPPTAGGGGVLRT